MKVYGDAVSGNCYKIQLTLALLEKPYQWIHVDILKGETKAPTFLALSPNGKIPILELSSGDVISESNAIVNYLAYSSNLLPEDPLALAKVQQWQFFEQYSHEPYIAVARYIEKYLGLPEDRLEDYKSKQEGGYRALDVMEQQLLKSKFLVGETLTVADISLFAYTHVCHEGGFALSNYPEIKRWIKEIKKHPKYTPME
ncbi:glutathione S-transferase family protein [Glaciecola sp. KUL10]|uniref:glutathione S-transferase family protein n=1 Tax=Glaciecola sp. (strain KUL10) TaxID=2161813 RepID=UPI000D78ADEB|nr:glutathione S-transferase family protein [Glaciecola sp. KUL10]GBL06164.1 glutathione S-transferase domain-containing protein [Glaciecola sp. KUL10]